MKLWRPSANGVEIRSCRKCKFQTEHYDKDGKKYCNVCGTQFKRIILGRRNAYSESQFRGPKDDQYPLKKLPVPLQESKPTTQTLSAFKKAAIENQIIRRGRKKLIVEFFNDLAIIEE